MLGRFVFICVLVYLTAPLYGWFLSDPQPQTNRHMTQGGLMSEVIYEMLPPGFVLSHQPSNVSTMLMNARVKSESA